MNNKNDEFLILEETFIFTSTLERLWSIFRDLQLLMLFYKHNDVNLNVHHLNKSYIIGNEIQGSILNKINFTIKVVGLEMTPFFKKIKWSIYFKGYDVALCHVTNSLLKLSHKNNAILFYCKYKIKKNFFETIGISEEIICKNFKESSRSNLLDIEKFLNESSFNLVQYESCLIESTPDKIWYLIENPNKIKNLAPLYCLDFTMESERLEVGKMVKLTNNNTEYIIFKVSQVEKNENAKKWLVKLEYMFSIPPLPINSVYACITKVSGNRCQLAVCHNFNRGITMDNLNKISNTKRYLLSNLKDFLENYQK